MTNMSVKIRGTDSVVKGIRRAERSLSEAFDVGRFQTMTVVLRSLIMPRVPRRSGFLRSTAYVTRDGRIGFSAIYAARIHELSAHFAVGGPFFVRAPLTENAGLIGQLWAAHTSDALRQRKTMGAIEPVFPLTATLHRPPRNRVRRPSLGRAPRSRRRRA